MKIVALFILPLAVLVTACQSPGQSPDQAAARAVEPVISKVNSAAASKTPLQFILKKGSLKENLQRLLNNGDHQLLWNVSEHHQVATDITISAADLYQLVNDIVAPYKQPAQIKARFYGNHIVRFYYHGNERYVASTQSTKAQIN